MSWMQEAVYFIEWFFLIIVFCQSSVGFVWIETGSYLDGRDSNHLLYIKRNKKS